MALSIQEIAHEMARRRLAATPLLDRMMEIRDRYNADVVIPVPETDDDIPLESLAPLLIADAVDHPAMYAAQTPPNIFVPAIDPTKMTGVRSVDFAARRRKALYYVWDKSWWELMLGRMYRHLSGYAVSTLEVVFDFERREPRLVCRDPLGAYPEPKTPEDLSLPANVGFVIGKSLDWLHHNYPETMDRIPKSPGFTAASSSNEGEIWDIVRWVDEEQIVIGVLGPRDTYNNWINEPVRWAYELERFPNILGRCPAVVPRRVTLDRIISQLANLTGHVDVMAKLNYLDIRASERSVFPDRYVVAKTGQSPRLADGAWHDGATGQINRILDADAVGELRGAPDPNNKITLDRLERNFRVSSGLIPQAGGETYGALRTGRGIDALMGAALDPRTTELHRIAERYLSAANELILLAYGARWPTRTFSVYSPLDPGAVPFTPAEHVEFRDGAPFVENRVSYPIPGMDDINATQVIGQMMGARLIAAHDARVMHPHVKDPEGTERRLIIEEMEQMAVAALGQRATTPPGIPPEDFARMIELIYEGKRIHEAIGIANREAQERQASMPDQMPEGGPAPEAMPGLANVGEGEEAGMGGGLVSNQGTDLERFREILGALRSTGAPA